MKKIIFLLPVLLLVCCGKPSGKFSITGEVMGGGFENEKIYLVPFEGANPENTDTAIIQNGRFRFEGIIDTPEIRIIRTRPILRLLVEEILVVVEPGHIEVILDAISSAKGTSQNELLQQWKEHKWQVNRKRTLLSQQMRNVGESDKSLLKEQIEEITQADILYNYQFVKTHRNSTVGDFVYKQNHTFFTEEQQNELKVLKE